MTCQTLSLKFDAPGGGRSVVLEDDGHVAYAYLLDGERIVGDAWLYNVDEAPADSDWKKQPHRPFLNPRAYCTEATLPRLRADSVVTCDWSGDAVVVVVGGEVWARLANGTKPGFSRLAARAGPLAKPLDEVVR